MNTEQAVLPSFRAPPVDDVSIAVQFQSIERFSLAYGAFFERVKGQYPRYEEHDPKPVHFETFGKREQSFPEFSLEAISLRRGWYSTEIGDRVIQLQPNRLAQSWVRQSDSDAYPRFPAVLADFLESYSILSQIAESLGLSTPNVNQVEVLYSNTIPLEGSEDYLSAFRRIFGWPLQVPCPEVNGYRIESEAPKLTYSARVFPPASTSPCARLFASASPADTGDERRAVRFWLRFRGPPTSTDVNELEAFLLAGRASIVKSFADLTSSECHLSWQRED